MEFSIFDGSTEIGSKGEASVHQAEVAIRLGKLNAYVRILNPIHYNFFNSCMRACVRGAIPFTLSFCL